jgi:hypothetical protein
VGGGEVLDLEPRKGKKMKEKITEALLEAHEQLRLAQEREANTGEAMDSMTRTYWEGQAEALAYVAKIYAEEAKK